VYQSDPDRRPDSDYEPGRFDHWLPGNRGRIMDHRRTPVRVAGLRPEAGFVLVEVTGFEDRGAVWEVPLENVHHFQWEKGSALATAAEAEALRRAAARFDSVFSVEADPAAAEATATAVARARAEAASWLDAHSRCFPGPGPEVAPGEGRADPRLWADAQGFFDRRGVLDMETEFARIFVSNPYSGDCVKGHRIVIAELGLVRYQGPVPRDPEIFAGAWSRERRARHVVSRLGLVREVLHRLGLDRMPLYRGMSFKSLEPAENRTFVSATFQRAVAEAHFTANPEACGVLYRRWVPAERALMTFLETEAMNGVFREAEAVLLHDPGGLF